MNAPENPVDPSTPASIAPPVPARPPALALLYADEDFPHPVAERLRDFGYDVVTVHQAGRANKKIPDPQVLADATALERAVLTHNRRDYIRMHKASPRHAGIIACTRDPDVDGLAQRIHAAIQAEPDLQGKLIRVTK